MDMEEWERRLYRQCIDDWAHSIENLGDEIVESVGKSKQVVSGCVNKMIHGADRARLKLKSVAPHCRLRLPDVPKIVRATKLKRSYYSELKEEASTYEESAVAKKKELDDMKMKMNKEKVTKHTLYQTEIKIWKSTMSFTLSTEVKRNLSRS